VSLFHKPSETVAQKRQSKARCRDHREVRLPHPAGYVLYHARCFELVEDLIGDCDYSRDKRDYGTCLEPGRWSEVGRNWHATAKGSP
jgi:hypothetical protein